MHQPVVDVVLAIRVQLNSVYDICNTVHENASRYTDEIINNAYSFLCPTLITRYGKKQQRAHNAVLYNVLKQVRCGTVLTMDMNRSNQISIYRTFVDAARSGECKFGGKINGHKINVRGHMIDSPACSANFVIGA